MPANPSRRRPDAGHDAGAGDSPHRGNLNMTEHDPPVENTPPPDPALGELRRAQADLARLSDLLAHGFDELLQSFNAIQAAAAAPGGAADIAAFTGRAIVALQCEDIAGQLISHASVRIGRALEALRLHPHVPTTELPAAVWAAGVATCAGTQTAGPVQQDAMHPGTIEFF